MLFVRNKMISHLIDNTWDDVIGHEYELNLTRGSPSKKLWQSPLDALVSWPLSDCITSSKPTSASCIRSGSGWLWVAEVHGQLSRIHSAMSCHCERVVALLDYNRHDAVFHTTLTLRHSLSLMTTGVM